MRMLICGLPGRGKTALSKLIVSRLPGTVHLNADVVRGILQDWDFSLNGRMRQALRMRQLAELSAQTSEERLTLLDFVAPTSQARSIVQADRIVYVNTIQAGRFEDTNAVFEKPTQVDMEVTTWGDFEDAAETCAQWGAGAE